MDIKVKGHSGCKIEIINNGVKLFIRKSTKDPNYVLRLNKQIEKQIAAYKNPCMHIKIPEIYSYHTTENEAYFDMEYIYSQNFVDYFEDSNFSNISYFVKALKMFVDFELETSPLQDVDTKIFFDKFQAVKQNCKSNSYVKDDIDIKRILIDSEKEIYKIGPKMTLPIGKCHGDLTYSNILFNGNYYYLIDFLDSFIESPLIDLVKIRQDTKYGWSQLMYNDNFDITRLDLISKKIDQEINDSYKKYEWYGLYYKRFQLMNFLRILQYAKDDNVIEYLKKVIISLL